MTPQELRRLIEKAVTRNSVYGISKDEFVDTILAHGDDIADEWEKLLKILEEVRKAVKKNTIIFSDNKHPPEYCQRAADLIIRQAMLDFDGMTVEQWKEKVAKESSGMVCHSVSKIL